MEINEIFLDIDAAENGRWFPYGDAEVRIAKWMNKGHATFLRDISKEHGLKFANNAISEEQAEELNAGQWPHIITGLRGFTDGGKPVKWTAKLIKTLSVDPKWSAFFKSAILLSKEEANYREANIKALEKSSPSTLSGVTGGRVKKTD